MEESTVTLKGQTTIPKSIRDRLGLKTGSKLRFLVGHDGRVTLSPVLPASALRGILRHDGPAATIEEMDAAIAERAVRRDERSKRK
jgi:antitoxin PrlF